ncbi:hypothetical protein ACIRSS_07455 [Amycolatopsis sp. NPDC101161]|uniref:hypothetical protein n=1 Tax=Amycolatopsis sp. NPDC101161 TaxID=3363940 RepID=UPI00380B8EF3
MSDHQAGSVTSRQAQSEDFAARRRREKAAGTPPAPTRSSPASTRCPRAAPAGGR